MPLTIPQGGTGAQIFDQEQVSAELSNITTAIDNIQKAINGYLPIAYSLVGSSEDIKESVENSLKSIKTSYNNDMMPELESIKKIITDVGETYGLTIGGITGVSSGGTGAGVVTNETK